MSDSIENDIAVANDGFKVVSETVGESIRSIRISLKERNNSDQEKGHLFLKDFGNFVYFAGMHVDESFREQGIATSFLAKAQAYLDENNKFGFVSNQITHANGARGMYGPPDWHPLTEKNWMIYIPKALRNPNASLAIPLMDIEIDQIVETCKKN